MPAGLHNAKQRDGESEPAGGAGPAPAGGLLWWSRRLKVPLCQAWPYPRSSLCSRRGGSALWTVCPGRRSWSVFRTFSSFPGPKKPPDPVRGLKICPEVLRGRWCWVTGVPPRSPRWAQNCRALDVFLGAAGARSLRAAGSSVQHRVLRGRFTSPCALTANVDGKLLCGAAGSCPMRAGWGFERPEQIICSESLVRRTWPLLLVRRWPSRMRFPHVR